MSDMNQISSLHVKGKVVIEFSSNSPPPPSTPAKAPVDSSAPRQSAPVSPEELAYQLDVMASVLKEVHDFQQQRLEDRRRLHEFFLARILTDLEGLEKRADYLESRN